jgi:hypothetical protein
MILKFGDPMIDIELANLVLRIKFNIAIFCFIGNKAMKVYKDLDTTSILYIKIFVFNNFHYVKYVYLKLGKVN